ncbi:MAG: mechanosensitive ion channel [Deltaproteobacteria bacterium]|nr:mechanosensitive ion channel [Deltaproteobacteria bacterium]
MKPYITSIRAFYSNLNALEQMALSVGCGVLFYLLVRILTLVLTRRILPAVFKDVWDQFKTTNRRFLSVVHIATILASIHLAFFLQGYTGHVPTLVQILLAVISVYIAIGTVSLFLEAHYRRRPSKHKIPALVRDSGKVILYLIIVIWLLGVYFNVNFTSLLTTSAIFSLIIGLALQDTLGNLFAGLSIQMDNPFKIGDWVLVEGKECRVIEINWRSVKLVDRSEDMIVVPNNAIAKSSLVNYSAPWRSHLCRKNIGVSYDHPPNQAAAVLIQSALGIDEVQKTPPPTVFLIEYGDFAIVYQLRFWITDYDRVRAIEDKVFRRIWYQFKRNGIKIPYPVRDVRVQPEVTPEERKSAVEKILRSIDFLSPLSDDDFRFLSGEVYVEYYSQGETLIRQGDDGESFYIVGSGSVEVYADSSQKQRTRIACLTAGNFFGELSVLTGEKRSATVTAETDCEVFVLHRKSFQHIIKSHPALAENISSVLATRLAEKERAVELSDQKYMESESVRLKALTGGRKEASIRDKLLFGIREIFGI